MGYSNSQSLCACGQCQDSIPVSVDPFHTTHSPRLLNVIKKVVCPFRAEVAFAVDITEPGVTQKGSSGCDLGGII